MAIQLGNQVTHHLCRREKSMRFFLGKFLLLASVILFAISGCSTVEPNVPGEYLPEPGEPDLTTQATCPAPKWIEPKQDKNLEWLYRSWIQGKLKTDTYIKRLNNALVKDYGTQYPLCWTAIILEKGTYTVLGHAGSANIVLTGSGGAIAGSAIPSFKSYCRLQPRKVAQNICLPP